MPAFTSPVPKHWLHEMLCDPLPEQCEHFATHESYAFPRVGCSVDHPHVALGLDGEPHDVVATHPEAEGLSVRERNPNRLLAVGSCHSVKPLGHGSIVANSESARTPDRWASSRRPPIVGGQGDRRQERRWPTSRVEGSCCPLSRRRCPKLCGSTCKPGKGYCPSYRVDATQRMSLPKPPGLRFSQQGWEREERAEIGSWVR